MNNTEHNVNVTIDAFIARLKRRQVEDAYAIALETLQILKRFISQARWIHVGELIEQMRNLGNRLEKAHPTAFASGNVVRRVLAVLRDELEDEVETEAGIASMFDLLQRPQSQSIQQKTTLSNTSNTASSPVTMGSRGGLTYKTDFRQIAIQGIKDLIDEITNIDEGIQQIAIDLIHDHEILLTPTPESKTVQRFLIRARERGNRTFTVLVTEGFPNNTQRSHEFSRKLADHGIETTIIPDSAVFALMSRVGKVIVGTKTVFVNGGTISSTSGVSSVCECAREFKTPVFAVTGLYKLSPLYPNDVQKSIEYGGAKSVLPHLNPNIRLDTINPISDYIPPENIDIYITNIGGFAPSFIYRIAWDNYKQIDVNLESEKQ